MASGSLSDQVISQWLTDLAARAAYVSLHTALPDFALPDNSEVPGQAGYSRSASAWSLQSNRSIANTVAMQFNLALETNIAALGLREDLTGGILLGYAVPPPGFPIVVPQTGLLTIPIGEVVFAL